MSAPSVAKIKAGDSLSPTYAYESDTPGWEGMSQILSFGAILIKNGIAQKQFPDFTASEFPVSRTLVGILPSGEWIVAVVEKGWKLKDLTSYLLRLGSKDAVSLDGGPSSELFLSQMNRTLGGTQHRRLSDAIVILPATPKPN